ncbi:MAG: hypothetical protein FJ255_08935 [Phycisphaerae bacterium]|nr:hypothetical protein [Phycisphaerae bacterium]
MRCRAAIRAGCVCAVVFPGVAWAQVSFTRLAGFAGDDRTFAFGVSLDGGIVGGNSGTLTSRRGFAWGSGAGFTPLAGVGAFHSATAVSGHGATLGGVSNNRAAVWARGGGDPTLMPQTIFAGGQVTGLSGDGGLAVGFGVPIAGPQGAFAWLTASGVVQPLPSLPGTTSSQANGVSAGGGLIVGAASTPSGPAAWAWTAGGTVPLATPPGATRTWAQGVSFEGARIVGYSGDSASEWATAWDLVGGAWVGEVLGTLPGDVRARARGVSALGRTIVGSSIDGSGDWRAFVWSRSEGMRDLNAVLGGLGVALGSFRLEAATGISADGRTIVGYGVTGAGRTEGFVAVIPSPWGVLILAGLGLRRGRCAVGVGGAPG